MSTSRLSDHVEQAVAREREVVAARLAAMRDQSARLHAVVQRLDAEIAETERVLRGMDEILGLAPQLSFYGQGEIRGQRLQDTAVELLRHLRGSGTTIHYREWFELLVAEGVQVGGRDPVATFLTQINRAADVESVRPRSGLYRLR